MHNLAPQYFERRKQLIKYKYDFDLIKTTNTTVIKYLDQKEMYSLGFIQQKYLYLFQEIKKETHKNLISNNITDMEDHSKDANYFRFNGIPISKKIGETHTFNNCLEFDINKAYYKAALNLGFISEEYYFKYITLPKEIRLKLIGALGTNKAHFTYEKGKLKNIQHLNDQLLRKCWFSIVNEIDNVLRFFASRLGEDFIFYWVDGIYCKYSDASEEILKEVSEYFGYDFSADFIDKIEVKRTDKNVCNVSVKMSGGRNKTFFTKNIFL
tara:strand:+ start:1572 stop:2375 length:804 start_codon:yes stop_codon:yes gene_type:complete